MGLEKNECLEETIKKADNVVVFENPLRSGPRKIIIHFTGFIHAPDCGGGNQLLGEYIQEDNKSYYYLPLHEDIMENLLMELNSSEELKKMIALYVQKFPQDTRF